MPTSKNLTADSADKRRTKPLTAIAVAAAKHWQLTLALWVGLLAAGGYAYFDGLDREGFPAIDTPYALVNAPYFADDPEIVDADVARPIDAALANVDGVHATTSYSGSNQATVWVEFDSGISSMQGVELIRDVHTGLIPESVDVFYNPVEAAKFLNQYDLLVSVSSGQSLSTEELQSEATRLAEHVATNPNVDGATVALQIEQAPDPETGQFVERQTSFARIYNPETSQFVPTVLVGVERADTGLDVLEFSDSINGSLASAPLADGIDATISADFATDITYQLNSLQRNLMTGLLAVAVVSLLLIGWRVAVMTAAFMVTVLAASVLCLLLLGQTLNTITLFALILTLGLLVDDAIVIAESIDANRRVGGGPLNVIRVAVDRVGAASFSGTLTTVLVFMPMLFISGLLGEFIRSMPVTVIVTLLCSFVLSIVVIPMMGSQFLLVGEAPDNPIIRGERATASLLYRMLTLFDRNRAAGLAAATVSIGASIVIVVAGLQTLGSLTFNIFPPSKDSNGLVVETEFDDDVDLAAAQRISDTVDATIADTIDDLLLAGTYYRGNATNSVIELKLIDMTERNVTSHEIAAQLEAALAPIEGAASTVGQIDNGPPSEEFPWAVQINAEQDPAAAAVLADDIVDALTGATVTRNNGETATLVEAKVSTEGQVVRFDGQRTIEVRGRFDADDTTALTEAAEAELHELFPASALTERGFEGDVFSFDYGQESDSQESFGSAVNAMYVALIAMLVLLVFQFRSLVQPVLILLAIPFSLFGVANALKFSDNALSFFVMIGLIGLIGIVVNNTILLTDAANQEWRNGATNTQAIASAVESRFRPLVVTTATTVVGLAPLALSDPFWEALSLTIMFGLISSTVLVLLAFPFYYLLLVPPGRLLARRLRNRR